MSSEPMPDFPRSRADVEATIRRVLASGATGQQLEDKLVDELSKVADNMAIRGFLHMLGVHLAALPEEQGKAQMFDMLTQIGALEELMAAAARRAGSSTDA